MSFRPARNTPGEKPGGTRGSLRGVRAKHTPRIAIPKNRSATPARARSFTRTSTIYSRYGESLKNERAVRWRLCMMIKKSCLPTRAAPVHRRREEERAQRFNQRASLIPEQTARCFKMIGCEIIMPAATVGIIIPAIIGINCNVRYTC